MKTNNILNYKEYSALIEFSADDGCLIGEVLHINDMLVFHGYSPEEIESNFHAVIDEYLARCNKDGKQPNKPYNGVFQVRLQPEQHKAVAHKAAKLNTSINNIVVIAVQTYLQNATIEVHHTHDHNHIHTVKVEDVQISASMQPTWSKTYASTTQSIQ